MKKILVLVVLVIALLGVTAYANLDLKIVPLEGDCAVYDYTPLEEMPDAEVVKTEYDKLYEGLSNCDGVIEFVYEIPADDKYMENYKKYASVLAELYFNVAFENPELMQVATKYTIPADIDWNDTYTAYVLKIHFVPTYVLEPEIPKDFTEEQIDAFLLSEERDSYLKKNIPPLVKKAILHAESVVADAIKEDMTDEEKVLVLHDFIIDHTHYNTPYVLTTPTPVTNEHWQNHTAFGVFNNHMAVCQGYALAYNLLLTRAGVENKYVTGIANGGGHAWVVVKLDGEWYHVDPTHDDPSNADCIGHGHFLVSDKTIYDLGHTTWETDVTCTSDKYNAINYCFHDVNPIDETIHYNNGYFYAYRHLHIDNETGNLVPEYGIDKHYDRYYRADRDGDGEYELFFVYEYVKSKFDGSEMEIINEAAYKKAFVKDEKPEINSLYVDEKGNAHDLTISNVGEGKIFVRMVDDTKPDVYVAFYDADGKLIKMSKPELLHENAVEIADIKPEGEFARVTVFAWSDGTLKPITDSLVVE